MRRNKNIKSGTKHLRIAGVIQIILGIVGILFIRFLLQNGDASAVGVTGQTAIGLLVLSYAAYAFQIFAGIMGILKANKKSLFTVILGVLLFVPQLITFLHVNGDILLILVNAVLLAIPYYYLHNAYKNFKE